MAKNNRPTLILATVLFLCVISFYAGLKCSRIARKYPEPFTPRIMSVIELQEAVGAAPDGVVGPNTLSKWETAYANQEAAKFMTASGKPK